MILEYAFNILNVFLHKYIVTRPFIPVSYTHLDVYKRQAWYFPRAPCVLRMRNCVGLKDKLSTHISENKLSTW